MVIGKWLVPLVLILIAILISGLLVLAGDENQIGGNPNDDNACYEGGDWGDGRCVNDWWWNAGWYRQAVEGGRITYEQVPDMYKGGSADLGNGFIPVATQDQAAPVPIATP